MPRHKQAVLEDFLGLLVLFDITRDLAAEEGLRGFCLGASVAPARTCSLGFSDSAAFQDTQQMWGVQRKPARCTLVVEV